VGAQGVRGGAGRYRLGDTTGGNSSWVRVYQGNGAYRIPSVAASAPSELPVPGLQATEGREDVMRLAFGAVTMVVGFAVFVGLRAGDTGPVALDGRGVVEFAAALAMLVGMATICAWLLDQWAPR
jgi:hypothetical protein